MDKDVYGFPCHSHGFLWFFGNNFHVGKGSADGSGIGASFATFLPEVFVHSMYGRSLSDLPYATLIAFGRDLVYQGVWVVRS